MANDNNNRGGIFGLLDTPSMRRKRANLRSLQQAAKRAPTPEEALQRTTALFEFQQQQISGIKGLAGKALDRAFGKVRQQLRETKIQREQEEAPTIASKEAALERRRRRLRTGRRLPSLFAGDNGQTSPGGQLLV